MDAEKRAGMLALERAFRMAETGMRLAEQAAEALASGEHESLRLLLEAARAVTYAPTRAA